MLLGREGCCWGGMFLLGQDLGRRECCPEKFGIGEKNGDVIKNCLLHTFFLLPYICSLYFPFISHKKILLTIPPYIYKILLSRTSILYERILLLNGLISRLLNSGSL